MFSVGPSAAFVGLLVERRYPAFENIVKVLTRSYCNDETDCFVTMNR